jgi:hypothetical protein
MTSDFWATMVCVNGDLHFDRVYDGRAYMDYQAKASIVVKAFWGNSPNLFAVCKRRNGKLIEDIENQHSNTTSSPPSGMQLLHGAQ